MQAQGTAAKFNASADGGCLSVHPVPDPFQSDPLFKTQQHQEIDNCTLDVCLRNRLQAGIRRSGAACVSHSLHSHPRSDLIAPWGLCLDVHLATLAHPAPRLGSTRFHLGSTATLYRKVPGTPLLNVCSYRTESALASQSATRAGRWISPDRPGKARWHAGHCPGRFHLVPARFHPANLSKTQQHQGIGHQTQAELHRNRSPGKKSVQLV